MQAEQEENRRKEKAENPYSVFGAANKAVKRRYAMYRQMVETSGGKNVPLSFEQWKAAGMPTE